MFGALARNSVSEEPARATSGVGDEGVEPPTLSV